MMNRRMDGWTHFEVIRLEDHQSGREGEIYPSQSLRNVSKSAQLKTIEGVDYVLPKAGMSIEIEGKGKGS